VDPSARGFFFAQAAGDARAHSGVRALGPVSPSVRGPTLRLVGPHLEVALGDIVTEHVHAVVNAANPSLLGGGGGFGVVFELTPCAADAACPTGWSERVLHS